jgi:hypothetical protein
MRVELSWCTRQCREKLGRTMMGKDVMRKLPSQSLLLPYVNPIVLILNVHSSFGGNMWASTVQNGNLMEMKKGKMIPQQMRTQYKRQQEMSEMKKEMDEQSQPGIDGLPVFNLYVRTKRQNVS